MRVLPERAVFTVQKHNGQWALEHDGHYSDHSDDKEIVKAAANKRARAALDDGMACQVRVAGEHGFFGG